MSEAFTPPSHEVIRAVADRLARAYPYIEQRKAGEGVFIDTPLASLIRAILSQNTTDVGRDRAFNALRQRYPAWEDIIDVPTEEVAEIIRASNYAFTKAGRIQNLLRILRDEHGTPTLDFLSEWPTKRIITYLTGFPGVGNKSAAIVCLFSLHRPVMPVDTHVLRVAKRLVWVPEKAGADRTQVILQQHVPPELVFPLHIGMWEHGHATCRPVPLCMRCAIYEFCAYPQKTAPQPPVEEAIAKTSGLAA